MSKRIHIDMYNDGTGKLHLFENNIKKKTYPCQGKSGLDYYKTLDFVVIYEKFSKKYSNEFNVWMPYAILIGWKRGIYIHEGWVDKSGGDTAGCIHLESGTAKNVYNWVETGKTKLTFWVEW